MEMTSETNPMPVIRRKDRYGRNQNRDITQLEHRKE